MCCPQSFKLSRFPTYKLWAMWKVVFLHIQGEVLSQICFSLGITTEIIHSVQNHTGSYCHLPRIFILRGLFESINHPRIYFKCQQCHKDKRYLKSILWHENKNKEERYGDTIPGPVLEGKQRSLARTDHFPCRFTSPSLSRENTRTVVKLVLVDTTLLVHISSSTDSTRRWSFHIFSTVIFSINSRENFWIFTCRDIASESELVGRYNPFIHSLCDTQLGLTKMRSLKYTPACRPISSVADIKYVTSCTKQVTDLVISEWTEIRHLKVNLRSFNRNMLNGWKRNVSNFWGTLLFSLLVQSCWHVSLLVRIRQ